jgi:hypothetical protein
MAPKSSPNLTKWQKFLKKNAGKGYSTSELSKMYHKQDTLKSKQKKDKTSASLTRKPRSFTKKVCQEMVSAKIKVNMDELKKGRYASPEQAIAVSISQVKDKYPRCKKFYKR